MAFRRAILRGPLVLLLLATAAHAELSGSASSALGTEVTVTGSVPQGDNSFEPAIYVDWNGGSCPATVTAAKETVKGKTTRGLGSVEIVPGHDPAGPLPIRAKIVIQQPRQRVCAYGGGGALAGSLLIAGTLTLPPRSDGAELRNWSLAGMDLVGWKGHRPIRDPLGWSLTVRFRGTRPTGGTLVCKRKRFALIAAKIRFSAASGALAYDGVVRPDNSKNYDAPIPLPYHGRATLRVSGSGLYIGATPVRMPVDKTPRPGPSGGGTRPGLWGAPILPLAGTFRAPGFKPFAGEPGCGPGFRSPMTPPVNPPVNFNQGTAATEFGAGHAGEAGIKNEVPDFPPFFEILPSGGGSVSAALGNNPVTFSARDEVSGTAGDWAGYHWDFGDGATSELPSPTHLFAPGDWTVTLTVTGKNGLSATKSVPIYAM